jgi:hypothetical protein
LDFFLYPYYLSFRRGVQHWLPRSALAASGSGALYTFFSRFWYEAVGGGGGGGCCMVSAHLILLFASAALSPLWIFLCSGSLFFGV